MRPTIVAGFSLLLAGCASMPDKPVVESGQLELVGPREDWHVLAGLTDGSDAIHSAPMEDYDKAQCFKPKPWEEIKVYIHLLEEFGKHCKAQVCR